MAEKGDIPKGSVLVIEQFDRFSRLPFEQSEMLVYRLFKVGIAIGHVQQNRILEPSSWGSMPDRLMMMFEMNQANAHVKRQTPIIEQGWYKKQDKLELGKYLTRNAAHWFDVEGDAHHKNISLSINPLKRKLINAIAHKIVAGASLNDVLKWLSDKPHMSRCPIWKEGKRAGQKKSGMSPTFTI